MAAGEIVGAILGALIGLFIIISIAKAINIVREKENTIIERFGKFKCILTPGIHFILPWIDQPKAYTFRYFVTTASGATTYVEKTGLTKVLTQNEVLDFPKQNVITRDNATISVDAVLNYKIVNPKVMIYTTQNLPRMLSKVLQAQIRNVAGTLDVDQIIEDTAAMDRVKSEMKLVAVRWGVQIDFVKIQRVEAGSLTDVLAKKKNADLKNQEVIIRAKASKQKRVIESEGHRDRMIREAEGNAQAVRSRARGTAKATTNAARAEADSVRQIAAAIASTGENPTKYLLALKYLEALQQIATMANTDVRFLPHTTSVLQTLQMFGMSTIAPTKA